METKYLTKSNLLYHIRIHSDWGGGGGGGTYECPAHSLIPRFFFLRRLTRFTCNSSASSLWTTRRLMCLLKCLVEETCSHHPKHSNQFVKKSLPKSSEVSAHDGFEWECSKFWVPNSSSSGSEAKVGLLIQGGLNRTTFLTADWICLYTSSGGVIVQIWQRRKKFCYMRRDHSQPFVEIPKKST